MAPRDSQRQSSLHRAPLSRRRFVGASSATAVGLILAGQAGPGGVSAAQTGGAEYHGAWPFQVPPAGHFNHLEGVTNAVLGSAGGGTFSPYADLVVPTMGLYRWKDAEWIPRLAETWAFEPDSQEFVVTLKSGLMWSDGSPLTSQDVLSTVWATRALRNVVWNYIDGVEATDEFNLRFHMSKPSTVVERYVLKMHIVADAQYGAMATTVRDFFEAGGTMATPEAETILDELQNFRPEEILASGPFNFDYSSITNAQMTLVKNDNGLDADVVGFDRVVLYNGETPDITPVVLAQDVDYATHGFPPATEQAFMQQGLRIVRPPTYTGPALYINFDKLPEFNDKKTRQALAHAIDRAQNGQVSLLESGVAVDLMAGFSDTTVPNWLSEEDQGKLNKYELDQAKAEQLLTEAGWTKNGDAWQTADGKPAEYEILFPAEFADWSASATNVAEQLSAFGIQVTPRSVAFTQQPIDVDTGNFEMAIQAWGIGSNPHPHFSFVQDLFTHNIPIAANQGGKGIAFPLQQETDAAGAVDLEALVLNAAEGLDEAAQKEQVTQVALAFNELLPIVPLFERYGNNPVLEGVRVQPWPADDDPIYANALYGDNPGVVFLVTGVLKPV